MTTSDDPTVSGTPARADRDPSDGSRPFHGPGALDRLPCLAPFASLAVRFDSFSVCCSADQSVPFDAEPEQDVFNAPLYTDLRRTMLNGGELPSDCRACLRHNTTHRLFQTPEVRAIAADNLARMDEDYRIADFRLAYSFAGLDSACNLACRTCSSEFSTTYAKKLGRHSSRHIEEEKVIHPRRRTPDWVTELLEETRCCIELQGGEPFLDPTVASLLERIPPISVRIITNGTVYNRKALGRLRRFEDLVIWFSMDGSSRVSAYVRRGLDMERLRRNMRRIAEALPQSELRLNLTVSRFNVTDLADFVEELATVDEHVAGFDYHFVENIRAFRFTSIDSTTRASVVRRLRAAKVPEGRFRDRSLQLLEHVLAELREVDTYNPAEDRAFRSFNAAVDRDEHAG